MSHLPAYKKTITAVVGALLTWGTVVVTSEPTRITASEWLLAAGSLATALGVYATTNEPDPDDAGQSGINQLIGVVCLILILVFAWWMISALISATPR